MNGFAEKGPVECDHWGKGEEGEAGPSTVGGNYLSKGEFNFLVKFYATTGKRDELNG